MELKRRALKPRALRPDTDTLNNIMPTVHPVQRLTVRMRGSFFPGMARFSLTADARQPQLGGTGQRYHTTVSDGEALFALCTSVVLGRAASAQG